jgi:uncharacterized membrane protein YeaQ/YmgE (transglycosylase-associated protein family)
MIGMGFGAFLTLLIISAIWSAIVHGAGYRVLSGGESYLGKLIIGWIGGWLGSPVLGYWGGAIGRSNVHLIPAILGSFAAIFMEVAFMRAVTGVTLRRAVPPSEPLEQRAA